MASLFGGDVVWCESVDGSVAAQASQEVWRGKLKGGRDRYLSVRGQTIMPNRFFFEAIKELEWQPVHITVEWNQIDTNRLEARLRADKYAYLVRLSTGLETTSYSDNFFDLEPGEERTITVADNDQELTAGMVTVANYVRQSCEVEYVSNSAQNQI